jgi:gamma-glutamylcyclotransferase (GGCT)/AIG2-like uncharacterized protein YtfP
VDEIEFNKAMNTLFVYGTLKPGHFRFAVIEPFVIDEELIADTAKGILFDSGYDWPAAIFDNSLESEIPGFIIKINSNNLEEILTLLDEEEGVNSLLFRRKVIQTSSKVNCWTYEYARSTEGFKIIQSWDKY